MDKKNVLIVEDIIITAMDIKKSLLQMDYEVTDIVSNYDDALKSIDKKKPDIILLDIGLKGRKDGIELAQAIHKMGPIPIIYLTSNQDNETMLKAAATNPSAYLSKPFRRNELKSNLLIALNKTQKTTTLQPLGSEYLYDKKTKKIYYKKIPIYLSSKEKLFLQLLVESKGSLVPIDVIEEHLWGEDAPLAENSLRSLVYRLRTKLKYLPIETVPSFGYRLL